MKKAMRTKWFLRGLAFAALLTFALVPVAQAKKPSNAGDRVLGTWRVSICFPGTSFEDCDAATSAGGFPFFLYTHYQFHKENTMTAGDDFLMDRIAPGVWQKLDGGRGIAFTFEGWVFPHAGDPLGDERAAGRTRVRGTIQIDEDGDRLTGTATGDALDRDGNLLFNIVPFATVVGRRMEVIRE